VSDWRLELNGHMVEDLNGMTFYKVVFPDFWRRAYQEKNGFYRMIEQGAKAYVASTDKGHEFLEGEKIQFFWHEHCELCFEKAATDISAAFYCTADMEHWICEECFGDFKEQYNWQEEDASNYKITIDDKSEIYLITVVK
jgi:hypothetical protein